MKDSKFGLAFWLNLHSPHVKTHVIPSTDLYLPQYAAIFAANEKHMVLKCACDPNFFDYLVIFRYYFTEDGKVSCTLATISD